jgi:L-iditol 2-dehydrogenase
MATFLAIKNGKIIVFSGIKGKNDSLYDPQSIIDPNLIHYNQISVHGSFSSRPENLREALNLVKTGEVKLKDLITYTFSLVNINEAIITVESFMGLKLVINRFDF